MGHHIADGSLDVAAGPPETETGRAMGDAGDGTALRSGNSERKFWRTWITWGTKKIHGFRMV